MLVGGALWLILIRMELTVEQEHWLGGILGVVWEGAPSLGNVEAKNNQSSGTHGMLVEWNTLDLRGLFDTFPCQDVVFVFIELLLNISSEHF